MLGALDFASFALCDLCVEVEVRSSEVPWRPRSIVSIILVIYIILFICMHTRVVILIAST